MEESMSQVLTPEVILELCKSLQHKWFAGWSVNINSIAHIDPFGGSELTVLPTDGGSLLSTFKTWAVYYPPVGPAVYADKTVFKVEAESPAELLQKLEIQIRQIRIY
jgi:hypothetical protein